MRLLARLFLAGLFCLPSYSEEVTDPSQTTSQSGATDPAVGAGNSDSADREIARRRKKRRGRHKRHRRHKRH